MPKRIGVRTSFGYSRVVYLMTFTALISIEFLTLVTAGSYSLSRTFGFSRMLSSYSQGTRSL